MSDKKNAALAYIEEHLDIIEKKTGVNPKIILSILGAALLLTLIGLLDKYITCIVAITFPTYWSIKAIESDDQSDDTQWLTYWCVYACFTFIDLFAGFIMKFLPFYFFFKLLFLIWCFMPNTRGACYIYNWVIAPFFKKYKSKIESGVNKVLKTSNEFASRTKDMINENKDKIFEAGGAALNKVNEAMKTD